MRMTIMPEAEAARIAAPLDDAGLGCLRTERGNLPLERLVMYTKISGLIAHTELTQAFVNTHDQPLEATYVFPLPDRAAVTGMRMTADGRTIVAKLEERGAAREAYDQAVAAGKRASIAEEERPDVFTMRVGNILPGERVQIALTLAGPLSYADGEALFRFPLVVAPRYIPGAALGVDPAGDGYAPDTDAVPDASRITPPVLLPGFPHPVALAIDVDIDPAGLPLAEVRSSLHVVSTQDNHLTVLPGERADRDFVLRLAYGAQAAATSLVLHPDESSDGGTFRLTVLPPVVAGAAPARDVVLLLDRSGSMDGWKMVAARRAAARIVDTLGDGDRFAVLAFDHEVATPPDLPAGLVAATDRHRFRAVEHLAKMDARGGTELLEPMRQALDLLSSTADSVPSASQRDRVLVLVTDGQVGNEDELLRAAFDRLRGIRVHTVGVDRAVNAGFLGRLAAAGGGRFELVESEDRLDEAMDTIHRRIGAPLVTGLSLAASGMSIVDGTVSPARMPALFSAVPLVVSGRYSLVDGGEPVLLVSGVARDGSAWSTSVHGRVVSQPAVPVTWARAHLRDLEDTYAGESIVDRDALERQIVDVSLRYGVLCRFTAYVAVDERVVTDGSQPHRVLQPVEPVSGWDMLGAIGAVGAAVPAPAMMRMAALSKPMPGRQFLRSHGGGAQAMPAELEVSPPAMSAPMMPPPPAPAPAGPGFAPAMAQFAEFDRPSAPTLSAPALAERELVLLRDAADRPEYERRELLDDLGSRLDALVEIVTEERLRGLLGQLAEALRPEILRVRSLASVWELALRVLGELAGSSGSAESSGSAGSSAPSGSSGSSGSSRSAPRRAFWKR